MIEKIKSILLVFLVILSLLLISANNMFDFNRDNAALSEYYPQITLGDSKELEQIVMPETVVVHSEDEKNFLLNRNNEFYSLIYNEVKKFTFFTPVLVEEQIDWNELRGEKRGLELFFSQPHDSDTLKSIFDLTASFPYIQSIDRIWFFTDDMQDVGAYFISEELDRVYFARTINTAPLINEYLSQLEGEQEFSYHIAGEENEGKTVETGYYLPIEGLVADRISKKYLTLTENNIIKMIFSVPSSVRLFYSEDNHDSVYYTDGISSLEYYNEANLFSYYQPVLEEKIGLNVESELSATIKFINQHGGWDGDYLLCAADKKFEEARINFSFRKYIDGIPIYSSYEAYGEIKTEANNNVVSNYKRSTILAEKVTRKAQTNMSGAELLESLSENSIKEVQINNINLVYLLTKSKSSLELEPYWLIKYDESAIFMIAAVK